MNKYSTSKIRNVCLISHGGAGKTSLTEAMLLNAGAVDRLGKVVDGTTTTDYDPEETRRKISISTAIAPIEWNGTKINIIDTPGYFDFVGETLEGIRVADAAVILVSGKSGVESGTEKVWQYAAQRNLPKMIFISEMDDSNSNYFNVLEQLRDTFGKSVIPIQVPIKAGDKFNGYVKVVQMKAKKFDGKKDVDIEIPNDLIGKIEPMRSIIMEAVAETDEALMEKFFNEEAFTDDEIDTALQNGIRDGSIIPVLCGSTVGNMGVTYLLDAIEKYFPAPGSSLEVEDSSQLAALVFKTVADPYVGKLSIFKVMSGTISADSTVYNSNTGTTEKIGRLYVMRGKKQMETDKLETGDIGAVTKLLNTNTGDTLCNQSSPVKLEGIKFPEPMLSLAILPKAKGDEEKISSGLRKLVEEDPTIKLEQNIETHQQILSGIGDQHLDVVVSKLKSKFGVEVDLNTPVVPYREAIRKKVKVEGKHKKQSGGHGQYGHVWIEFEPGEQEGLTFEEKVFGGAVPRNYFPAVEKGLRESMLHGVLAGYPVVNLKATLVDGSYHPVDSSEMAFKIAASLAFKKGLEQASPVLLEPIGHVEVVVPSASMGDVIGDLNKRRGRIMGMEPDANGYERVIAEVPMSEMFKYATDLRSMTQARGSFSLKFERYEDAPPVVSQKVIEDSKRSKAGDE